MRDKEFQFTSCQVWLDIKVMYSLSSTSNFQRTTFYQIPSCQFSPLYERLGLLFKKQTVFFVTTAFFIVLFRTHKILNNRNKS